MLPTHLYIKQHTVTGKFYFGKTIKDPEKYSGSGKHWISHLKVHGYHHVVTLWYELFTDQEVMTKFALEFSEKMNIVKSDQWLNLIPENGINGGGQTDENMKKCHNASFASPNHISKHPERKLWVKWQAASTASPNANWKNPDHTKRFQTAGTIASNVQVICPHCKKEGQKVIMTRWHFDKCKFK
jgi:hypothetical protein